MNMEKTNVMRLLGAAGKEFRAHEYDSSITDGESVAAALGESPEQVFKTLVTVSGAGTYHVFVIPVNCTLNLKKAASAAGVKNIQMIKQKELLPLTGYIHGGCSPIGMKKPFPTYFEESATLYDRICVSAGRVGHQVELPVSEIVEYLRNQGMTAEFADLV